jgi:transcriptional regulator with XRE-family HTH domain
MIDSARDQLALGRALRELRRRAGITQEELAARVGTGATHISRVERGQFDVRWHTLRGLLHALDASLADLGNAIDRADD